MKWGGVAEPSIPSRCALRRVDKRLLYATVNGFIINLFFVLLLNQLFNLLKFIPS